MPFHPHDRHRRHSLGRPGAFLRRRAARSRDRCGRSLRGRFAQDAPFHGHTGDRADAWDRTDTPEEPASGPDTHRPPPELPEWEQYRQEHGEEG